METHEVLKFVFSGIQNYCYTSKPAINNTLMATFTLRGHTGNGNGWYNRLEILSTKPMKVHLSISTSKASRSEIVDLVADKWIALSKMNDVFVEDGACLNTVIVDVDDNKYNAEEFSSVWMETLNKLNSSHSFSDVTLISMDKAIFQAHKLILQSSSPVFAAMFQNDMKEKAKNEVVLNDLKGSTIREMLSFMYTGSCPNISSVVEDLVLAADQYQLDRLKSLCEVILIKGINIDNTIHLYLLADRLRLEKLRLVIFYSIKSNGGLKSYIASEAYSKLSIDELTDIIKNI